MAKLILSVAVAALASTAFAMPPAYRLAARQSAQGDYSNVTMGYSTLNWGSASPSDIINQALGANCAYGTTCDQTTWTQEATVCSDNSDGTSCVQMDINVVPTGAWPDDNMRQALIQALANAMSQGATTADVTIAGTGGGAYSSYIPGSEFTAYQQASFVGITVYHNDQSLVASMTATITVTEVNDDWCGADTSALFGAGGAVASAVGQGELATALGFVSAICA